MNIERGQIYFVNLSPVYGKEQAGTRPVLVLSIDTINDLPLVVTVVAGTKGSNIKAQLSNECASFARRKRITNRNSFYVFSNTIFGQRAFFL